jgi:hypothetical protein
MFSDIGLAFVFVFIIFYVTWRASNASRDTIKTELPANDEDDFLNDLVLPTSSSPDLASKILSRLVDATYHDPTLSYLPNSAIKDLVVQTAIEQELSKIEHSPGEIDRSKYQPERRSQLAEWVCKAAPRVFAITTQCDMEPSSLLLALMMFRRCGFDDSKLPLVDLSSPDMFPEKIWSPLKIDTFCKKQWMFLVPIFTRNNYDYDLKTECIFPFIPDGAVTTAGAFSRVYRISIHKDHHEYPEIKQVCTRTSSVDPN